ncbi:hypothetical protein [Flavobacterium sp. HNIBRBA15423]|uniref:hypothetical protein n=1 Tax=Flavobacterium sp. HNIBRBA15423 TaxID=3458683 RepID=UPI004044C453
MASTSEVGHAKNIANLNLLNTNIAALGTIYNPSNPKLVLSNLQTIYTNAFAKQESVNTLLAPYSVAVDEREAIFKPFNSELTKLRKAYKATEGVTSADLENFMTAVRKLKGVKKTPPKKTNDPNEEQINHSTSQMSYDQRTNNLDALIAILQNTPNYAPNETEYQIATYQNKKTAMLQKTQAVANTFIPLNKAREERNKTVYDDTDNLVDLGNKAKDYIATILDTKASQYKAIAKIKFKKR